MFRRSRIRTKLAAALAIPLVVLAAIAGFEVYTAHNDLSSTRAETDLAAASVGPGSLLVRLQDERNRASIDLIGLGAATDLPVATNAEARALTDESAAEFEAELEGLGSTVNEKFAPAWEVYAVTPEVRAGIDAYKGPMDLSNDEFADAVFSQYTAIIETFFDSTSSVGTSLNHAELRNGVEIIDAAARQNEMRARIVRRVVLHEIVGGDSASARIDVARLFDRAAGFDEKIKANSVGAFEGVGDETFAEPGVVSFNEQVDAFIRGRNIDINALLGTVSGDDSTGYTGLGNRAATILTEESSRIEGAAQTRQRVFGGLALLVILGGALLMWRAARSITRPLSSLQAQADEMANQTLPAAVRQILETPPDEDVVVPEVVPVTVDTDDEMSEVAAALSAVQASATGLAVEQAVLRRNIADSYVSLGRRNQNLLTRQLEVITDLELNEEDPDVLEGLFRLDHLATRMRRNAESLLVLAGVEPPRQWSAPMKIVDVVRAALGEVEDYRRVNVRNLEPAAITGGVAAEVAHVLAELIENALLFSPPEEPVEVKGRLTTAGYSIAIIDHGMGMTDEDLEVANRRLSGRESFTVAPYRYFGHYVAGHIASRLGVQVNLQRGDEGGITARVDLPMLLVADDEVSPPYATGRSVSEVEDAVGPEERRAERPSGRGTDRAAAVDLPDDLAGSAPADVAPELDGSSASDVDGLDGLRAASALSARGLEGLFDDKGDLDLDNGLGADLPSRNGHASVDPDRDAASHPDGPGGQWPDQGPSATTDGRDDERGGEAAPSEPQGPASQPEPAAFTLYADGRDEERPHDGPDPDGGAPAQPARGFGGLATVTPPAGGSMYTLAARAAREGSLGAATEQVEADGPTTQSGLTRRVRGAQRPDAPVVTTGPADTPAPDRSTPDEVYSFLSNFQSGVARGRADALGDGFDDTEDQR